jgi:hypothetical protein
VKIGISSFCFRCWLKKKYSESSFYLESSSLRRLETLSIVHEMKFLNKISKYGFLLGALVVVGWQILRKPSEEEEQQASEISTQTNEPPRIYFVESSFTRKYLDKKQLCAIESAAKHNPDMIVHVASVQGVIRESYKLPLFQQYPNIKFEIINATEVFEGTPFQEWWLNDRVSKVDGYFRVAHISDALRLVLIHEYGGVYSDIDTITLRNFKLFRNYSAFFFERDSGEMINSFFHLKKGHPFLKYLMQQYINEYDPNQWSKTGPELIAKHLQLYCNVSLLDLLYDMPRKPCDLVVFPKRFAYSLHWESADHFFENDHAWLANQFVDAHSLHFHAKRSGGMAKVYWNSSNIFDFFAFHNCPVLNDLSRTDISSNGYSY